MINVTYKPAIKDSIILVESIQVINFELTKPFTSDKNTASLKYTYKQSDSSTCNTTHTIYIKYLQVDGIVLFGELK